MAELEKLYQSKGELVTKLEIIQAQLQQVNKQIVELINQQNQPKGVEEVK